jgi:hypothetical protein
MEKLTNHWITDEIHVLINGNEQRGVLYFEKGEKEKQYSIRINSDLVLGNNTQITIVQDRSRIKKMSVPECVHYLVFNYNPKKGFG